MPDLALWQWLVLLLGAVQLWDRRLGLVHPGSLLLDLVLLPAMTLGAWVGVKTIRRISHVQFERYVLVPVAVSALLLLI
jgi:uncharacterized membrane protein YfcA